LVASRDSRHSFVPVLHKLAIVVVVSVVNLVRFPSLPFFRRQRLKPICRGYLRINQIASVPSECITICFIVSDQVLTHPGPPKQEK
jgi:hypothetical protein